MSRKREDDAGLPHARSISKRRRPLPPHGGVEDYRPSSKPPPATVLVTGLPPGCSVLDIKSRFEIYGPINRIRIDRDGSDCHLTFRSEPSAAAAVDAAADPSFGITLYSKPVQVVMTTETPTNKVHRSYSKLLRADAPLSRLGRGNRLGFRDNGGSSSLDVVPYRGRGIVAYDDIF